MGQPPSQGTGGPNRWLVGVPGTVPSLDYERTSRGSDCKKKQNLQLRNEAQLYSAALRSSLQDERAGSGVKGRDERQKTAPLTPLPARTGLVSLDKADVVIDRMTELAEAKRRVAKSGSACAEC